MWLARTSTLEGKGRGRGGEEWGRGNEERKWEEEMRILGHGQEGKKHKINSTKHIKGTQAIDDDDGWEERRGEERRGETEVR